jgi:plastocyanin
VYAHVEDSMNRKALVWGAAAVALLGCSGDDSTTDPGDGDSAATVEVRNNFFAPAALDVSVDATVTWEWQSGGTTHNVTFDDGTASDDRSSGNYTRTFTAPGTYDYHCTIHGPGMSGSVTVSAPSS